MQSRGASKLNTRVHFGMRSRQRVFDLETKEGRERGVALPFALDHLSISFELFRVTQTLHHERHPETCTREYSSMPLEACLRFTLVLHSLPSDLLSG